MLPDPVMDRQVTGQPGVPLLGVLERHRIGPFLAEGLDKPLGLAVGEACRPLSEECWGRGLVQLAGLLDDLLIERQAEQPELPLDSELEALLPF